MSGLYGDVALKCAFNLWIKISKKLKFSVGVKYGILSVKYDILIIAHKSG